MRDGCRLAAEYDVASVCVRPADVVRARAILAGTDVAVGTTIGFPHGNHLTETKVFEARRALTDGATELDMVIQIGALKSGRDSDVRADIAAVVEVAHHAGAIVKVIFENAYLTDDEKIRACHLTEQAGGDFVKTSTGFAPSGATHDDLRLMRANTSPHDRGQGGGRRPDARCAARGHGARGDARRGDGHRGDARRLQGAQGRPRARRRRRRRHGGRLLMPDEVRIGMLGSGFIARVPLRSACATCPAPGSWPTAAPGRDAADDVRRAPREPRRYDSIDGLCADPEVDLVVIVLPNHLHVEAVRAAAAPARPSLCTKPLGRNAAEAAEMLRLSGGRRLPRLPRERGLHAEVDAHRAR